MTLLSILKPTTLRPNENRNIKVAIPKVTQMLILKL